MVETFEIGKRQVKQESVGDAIRQFDPDEFDADTNEERPIALLAERRRQFLAGLKMRPAEENSASSE